MFSTFNTKSILILTFALLLSGTWLLGQGTYIHAKAILAQVLLETAWADSHQGRKEVKPWPWADTWPVSRLVVPRLGISRIVLAGASGSSLAFGPGHFFGTPQPGQQGNSIIAGHRDTHFKFLQHLKSGDVISVENTDKAPVHYLITNIMIVSKNDLHVLDQTTETKLTLITCYPFDAITTGGPLRYVVTAKQYTADNTVEI